MREPNVDDAKILLQLESVRQAPNLDHAFAWAAKQFQHKGTTTQLGPAEAAEADEAIARFSVFFETAGVLVRDGLLHEDVFFDRYYVGPFWKLAVESTEKTRKETGVSGLGENFEWLAKHEDAAQARINARHRETERSRA